MLGGWAAVRETYPGLAWWRRKSTRAALVWEHSVDQAIAAFSGDPGVVPIPHHDTLSFIFDDGVLCRMKKADLELRTSNIQTDLASLFHQHDEDLFGYSGLQRVEAAYVLNQFQTEMRWVGIVARDKKKTLWNFALDAVVERGTVLDFPEKARGKTADLAKLRNPKIDERKDNENE